MRTWPLFCFYLLSSSAEILDKGRELVTHILTSAASDLVNKGPIAEMTAGLELRRYNSPDIRQDMFYWARDSRNAQAEVRNITICPLYALSQLDRLLSYARGE